MAVAYVAGATANDGQSANSSSAAVTIPASAVAGHTALFCMVQNSGASTFTAPAGWTLLSGPDTINSNLRSAVWVKDLNSGDPGTTVTFTSSLGARLPGALSVYSGTSASLAGVALSTQTTAGTTHTTPSVVTSVDGTGIHAFFTMRDATAAPAPDVTVPSNHTARSVAKTNFAASPNFTVQASHRTTFGAAGTYGATTATSSEAATSLIYYVTLPPVLGSPPVASFTASATSGSAPLAVTFTDTSTNTPTAWSWNFGDGATSTVQNPSHTYASPGTYTVSMSATNAAGTDAAPTTTVTVAAAPGGGGMHMFQLAGGVYVPLTPFASSP